MNLLLASVSPFHPPAILVSGVLAGILYKKRFHQQNPDLFTMAGLVVVGSAWIQAVLQRILESSAWLLPQTVVNSPVVVIFYILSYPFWFWIGGWLVFGLLGKRPEEGGVVWLYRIDDRTATYSPAWESPDEEPTETATTDSERTNDQ